MKKRFRGSQSACDSDVHLSVDIFGAIESHIEWRDDMLECKGMRRPHGKGARLYFSGNLDRAIPDSDDFHRRSISFILSIPGLIEGKIADELPTGVTIIEENEGHFFSTGDAEICWSDIEQQTPLLDTQGKSIDGRYSISGITYCVAPVAEVNGVASINLSNLTFRGRLYWTH